eukprot:12938123-Ditylum_brightwellii.AAC.1
MSQLAGLLMTCPTPVAPSYTGRVLLHLWIKASQNRKESLISFLFSVWRETRIPLLKDLKCLMAYGIYTNTALTSKIAKRKLTEVEQHAFEAVKTAVAKNTLL